MLREWGSVLAAWGRQEKMAVQGGVNRWRRPTGFGRSWRQNEKWPVVREDGSVEMDMGNGEGRKEGRCVGLDRPGGRGGQGVGLVAGGCGLAQLQDFWGLGPPGAELWTSCH